MCTSSLLEQVLSLDFRTVLSQTALSKKNTFFGSTDNISRSKSSLSVHCQAKPAFSKALCTTDNSFNTLYQYLVLENNCICDPDESSKTAVMKPVMTQFGVNA